MQNLHIIAQKHVCTLKYTTQMYVLKGGTGTLSSMKSFVTAM